VPAINPGSVHSYLLIITCNNLHFNSVAQQYPSLKYLNRYVKKQVGSKWHDLGVELLEADDVATLDAIRSEPKSDNSTCCTRMFTIWLNKQPTATWNQLIEALRQPGIELNDLATKIEQMLLKSNQTGDLLLLANYRYILGHKKC